MKRGLMAFGTTAVLVALLFGLLSMGSINHTFSKIGSGLSSGGGESDYLDSGISGPVPSYKEDMSGLTTGKDATGSHYSAPSTGGGGSMMMSPTSTTGAVEESRSADMALPLVAPGDSASGYSTGKPYEPQQYQSNLTAGQVDDNAKYTEYLDYLRNNTYGNVTPIDVAQRIFVRVMDGSQQPIAGARVQLFDGSRQVFNGTTVSDGRILFFPSAADATQAKEFRAIISRGQTNVEATIRPNASEQVVTLGGVKDNTGPVNLDVVFLMDATGSMGDEIEKIKGTVGSIAQRIEQIPGSTAPRFGLVAFRDRGDDYVTRSWDFTSDIQQFSNNLGNVYAGGGGDTPESVNAGLHDAIHLPGWADNSTGRHLRLIVLVGDAPPHLDYQDDYRYPALLQEAVAAGITIFPVGASNLESDGEYIFRQFAQVTQGQFVFLTYANGVSGAPGLSTDKHVDDFTVQNLDSLIVNLIAGEIANQTGQNIGNTGSNTAAVVVPTNSVAAANTGIAAFIDDFINGRGGLFWGALLLVTVAVVLSTRKQITARIAPASTEAQAPEIYLPESSAEATFNEAIMWPIANEQSREEYATLTAAHLQPSHNPVELYMDVQPTQQPTVPLR